MATASFGVGFFMRPVGGVLLGIYADRKGRKAAMQLIMAIMALVSLLIACAPPYASIGIAAPLLIVRPDCCRALPPVANMPAQRPFWWKRHRQSAWLVWFLATGGPDAGHSGGVGMGALITHNLDQGQLEAWGWRLPFLVLIAPVGLWIRRYMDETEAFVEASPLMLLDWVGSCSRIIVISC
jgi:MFS family permease